MITAFGDFKIAIVLRRQSNAFFAAFLDQTMTYSCARFLSGQETLAQAQRNKLQSIIAKTGISADDHVLEIGCGWGSFAIEAAQQTGLLDRATAASRFNRQADQRPSRSTKASFP